MGVVCWTVCTKGSHSLNHAEVNHAPGSYVYTMGSLCRQVSTWRTEQLVYSSSCYIGVSKASTKAFEPKSSRSNFIFIQKSSFWELSYRKQCVRPLLVGATTCHVLLSGEVQNFWTYTYLTWIDLRLTVWPQCHRIYYISCSSRLC